MSSICNITWTIVSQNYGPWMVLWCVWCVRCADGRMWGRLVKVRWHIWLEMAQTLSILPTLIMSFWLTCLHRNTWCDSLSLLSSCEGDHVCVEQWTGNSEQATVCSEWWAMMCCCSTKIRLCVAKLISSLMAKWCLSGSSSGIAASNAAIYNFMSLLVLCILFLTVSLSYNPATVIPLICQCFVPPILCREDIVQS